MDAITFLASFRINAPKPDACISWNIASSKFSLNPLPTGGCHLDTLMILIGTFNWIYASLYSVKKSKALWTNRDGSCNFPPCITIFHCDHINHACTKNSSSSSNVNFCIISSTNCLMSHASQVPFCSFLILPAIHPWLHYIPTSHVEQIHPFLRKFHKSDP